jgi:hypothetical protein
MRKRVHMRWRTPCSASDFHLLFDAGYVTVDPDYRIQVSPTHRCRNCQRRALSTTCWPAHPLAQRPATPALTGTCWRGISVMCFWRDDASVLSGLGVI